MSRWIDSYDADDYFEEMRERLDGYSSDYEEQMQAVENTDAEVPGIAFTSLTNELHPSDDPLKQVCAGCNEPTHGGPCAAWDDELPF